MTKKKPDEASVDGEDRRVPEDEQPIVMAEAEDAGELPNQDRRAPEFPSTPAGDEAFADAQMDLTITVPRSMLKEIDRLVHLAEQDTGHAQQQYLQGARAAIAALG